MSSVTSALAHRTRRSDHESAEHAARRDPAAGRGGCGHASVRVEEGGGAEDHPEEGDQTRRDRQGVRIGCFKQTVIVRARELSELQTELFSGLRRNRSIERLYICPLRPVQLLREEINPLIQKLRQERASYLEYQKLLRELEHLTRLNVAVQYREAQVPAASAYSKS